MQLHSGLPDHPKFSQKLSKDGQTLACSSWHSNHPYRPGPARTRTRWCRLIGRDAPPERRGEQLVLGAALGVLLVLLSLVLVWLMVRRQGVFWEYAHDVGGGFKVHDSLVVWADNVDSEYLTNSDEKLIFAKLEASENTRQHYPICVRTAPPRDVLDE